MTILGELHIASGTDTVRGARDRFLAVNGFDVADYDARTVAIPLGPFTIRLPNSEGRKKLVPWHDLHHVATGYGTDPVGEAEISAFEIRAGDLNLAGWVYNGMALGLGLVVAPIRTWRAFARAEATRTLYGLGFAYEEALDMSVAELRRRMGVPDAGAATSPAALHHGVGRRTS